MNEIADGPAGVDLDEYLDHRAMVRSDQVLWENNGWSLRGTAGSREFLLWTSPYLLAGYPGGPFRLSRASVMQTTMVFADDPERPLDSPNEFVSVGWEPDELGDWSHWEVKRDEAGLSWRSPSREFRTSPEGWEIHGSHAGVATELSLRPAGSALWLARRESRLDDRGDRWFIGKARASGCLEIGGRRLDVDGQAMHERHVHMNARYNPVTLLQNRGVTWHTGYGDGIEYMVLARPSLGHNWGRAEIGDAVLDTAQGAAVAINELEHWVDPESGIRIPRRWELVLADTTSRLVVTTVAHARAFYLWSFLRDGVTVLHWWLCTTSADFVAGSRRFQLGGLRSEVHVNRTLYARHGERSLGWD